METVILRTSNCFCPLFFDIKRRVHCLVLVIILSVSLLLYVLLVVRHQTVIRETCLIKMVSVLEVFYLCSEINFTFEKLVCNYLFLIMFTFHRLGILHQSAFISAVDILRTFMKFNSLLIQILLT